MEEKQIPPSELSLKYMAWNIKEMTKAIQDIAVSLNDIKNVTYTINKILEKRMAVVPQQQRPKPAPVTPVEDEIPF